MFSIHDYSKHELMQLQLQPRLFFGTKRPWKKRNAVKYRHEPPRDVRTFLPPQLRSLDDVQRHTRTHPSFTAFTIYPANERTLRINRFLWKTATAGTFDIDEARQLFGTFVFSFGISPQLCRFLQGIQVNEIESAIVDFLVLLRHQMTHEGDFEGLQGIERGVIARIWKKVVAKVGLHPRGEPSDARCAHVLERLVQVSFMTPWRIHVFAVYSVPSPFQQLAYNNPRNPALFSPQKQFLRLDTILLVAILKMYLDWQTYVHVLHKTIGASYRVIGEALERATRSGCTRFVFRQAVSLLRLSNDRTSLISHVPVEVMERSIIPRILLQACEEIAPRKRKTICLNALFRTFGKILAENNTAHADMTAHFVHFAKARQETQVYSRVGVRDVIEYRIAVANDRAGSPLAFLSGGFGNPLQCIANLPICNFPQLLFDSNGRFCGYEKGRGIRTANKPYPLTREPWDTAN